MKILIVQHVEYEGPGIITEWLNENLHEFKVFHPTKDEAFPNVDVFDGIIILGGPMGTNDVEEYSWLKKEKIFLAEALRAKKSILGICLGSQLIAEALGAPIFKNKQPELGWFETKLHTNDFRKFLGIQVPESITPFHWHNDAFTLPKESVLLATSTITSVQAFLYGKKVLGLLFHLEADEQFVGEILEKDATCIDYKTEILNSETSAKAMNLKQNKRILFEILDFLMS